MDKKKRTKIFETLIIIGWVLVFSAFYRYWIPMDISGSWRIIRPDITIEGDFYLTGKEAIILVVGVLAIFAAFIFKYKRLPSFHS